MHIFMYCVFILPNSRTDMFSSKRFFMRKRRLFYKERDRTLPLFDVYLFDLFMVQKKRRLNQPSHIMNS